MSHTGHSCILPYAHPEQDSPHISPLPSILYLLVPLGTTQVFFLRSLVNSLGLCGKKGTSTFCYHIPQNFSRVWLSLLNLSLHGNSSPLFQTPTVTILLTLLLPLLTPKPKASGSFKTCSDSSNILVPLSSLGG